MESKDARKLEVRLTEEQRLKLLDLTRNGIAPAKKIRHARILLLSDAVHKDGRRSDEYIAEVLGVHVNTVARTRWKFVRGGEAVALERKPRETPPVPPKVDGNIEAQLIAICCGEAPEGRTRWTLKLLAEELVRRKLVTSISVECVRRALKKTNCSLGGNNAGASPSGTRPGSSRRWKTSSTCTPPSTRKRSR
jgi:hypothetical protein